MSIGTHSDMSSLRRVESAPGAIGHIARHRYINTANYTATDRWFHYDQVGSVMLATNASGAAAATYHPDAFGNLMASWQTGLWTNTYTERAGFHHNTKELDADTGLVYMYQRWYLPETGQFTSAATKARYKEDPYLAFVDNPALYVDPRGEWAAAAVVGGPVGVGVLITAATVGLVSFGAALLAVVPCETAIMRFTCNCGPQPSSYCYMGLNPVFSGPYLGKGHPGYVGDTPTESECAKFCGSGYKPCPNSTGVTNAQLEAAKYL